MHHFTGQPSPIDINEPSSSTADYATARLLNSRVLARRRPAWPPEVANFFLSYRRQNVDQHETLEYESHRGLERSKTHSLGPACKIKFVICRLRCLHMESRQQARCWRWVNLYVHAHTCTYLYPPAGSANYHV